MEMVPEEHLLFFFCVDYTIWPGMNLKFMKHNIDYYNTTFKLFVNIHISILFLVLFVYFQVGTIEESTSYPDPAN